MTLCALLHLVARSSTNANPCHGLADYPTPTCGTVLQDGRTLGDEWLERKGKAMPPGPEMRRGRTNLNEVFQQSSNPYQVCRVLNLQQPRLWVQAAMGAWALSRALPLVHLR